MGMALAEFRVAYHPLSLGMVDESRLALSSSYSLSFLIPSIRRAPLLKLSRGSNGGFRLLTQTPGCACRASLAVAKTAGEDKKEAHGQDFHTIVMKFGGSSVASAERMREVADIIMGFPEEHPILVLSAMGKTTNMLLMELEFLFIDSHEDQKPIEDNSIGEIGLLPSQPPITSEVEDFGGSNAELLEELGQLLMGISLMKELTVRTKDYLVSFGERLSTRIFAEYLKNRGIKARQYDAFDLGVITTDEFTNAEILEATYPAIAKRLHEDWLNDPAIPVVTGFLGKGCKTGAITTLGRGGSDLTATAIGKALGLREIQVWKDVDGVLTCDPKLHKAAAPVPFLTYDEAAELAYFGAQVLHPQSMRPAREGNIPVRVKNSYNPKALGTLITNSRDLSKTLLTSIVAKRNVTLLDIVSTRMLGQFGFLAKVFSIFEDLGISVDVVATSEVSISLTLDPSKLWSRELIQQELDHMMELLQEISVVNLLQKRCIISFIGNVERSSLILEKVNISVVVNDSEAERCVKALHSAFFEQGDIPHFENGVGATGMESTGDVLARAL